MDIKMLVRLGAVALVGVVAVVAVATFGDNDPLERDTRRLGERPTDPLGPMLVRCVELGEAALRDAGCRKTWMENRRRFLGTGPHSQAKPPQPNAGAPLSEATKSGAVNDSIPGPGDKNALTPDPGKSNDRLPDDAGIDAAKPDAKTDADPLQKPNAADPVEAE